MALKAAGFGGTNTLHELKGCSCDLCGAEADSQTAEVVALDCSFNKCPPASGMYHQACLEKYLKSIKCERNRKIGFPCPRGCGKATQYSASCPGKILKSHPISIRGEANKKRRQAELESLQRTATAEKEAGNGKAAKKEREDASKLSRSQSGASSVPPEDKSVRGGKAGSGGTAKAGGIKALNVNAAKLTSASSTSSMSAAAAKKEALAAEARKLKSEIAARSGGGGAAKASALAASSAANGGGAAAHGNRSREVKTLDEYLAERQGASSSALDRAGSSASGASVPTPPAANAWAAKSRASSASSLATDPVAQADPSLPSLDSDAFPPPPSQPAAAPLASGRPPVPLPRSSSAASAAASSAPAVPAPAQPPPPRGAWAQKQPAVMAVVPPPPPPPRGAASNVAAAAAPPAPPTAKAGAPPAAQQQQQEPKLSKSQRKNLRRAEKKAAAAAVATEPDAPSLDGGDSFQQAVESPAAAHPATPRRHAPPAPSPVPPPGFSPRAAAVAEAADVVPASPSSYPADMPLPPHFPPAPPEEPVACADLLDRCLQLAVQHKLRRQVESLTALGFAPAAALAAVQQHGGDLEAAVATLLEQATGVCDPSGPLSLAGSGPLPEVDLSEELQFMQALQAHYMLPPGVLESTVVDCNGDLEATARVLAEQCGGGLLAAGGGTAVGAGGNDLDAGLFYAPPAPTGQAALLSSQQAASQSHPLGPGWPWGGPADDVPSSSNPGALGLGGLGSSIWADTVGGGASSNYSAFSFGGFTEAALTAVHGGGGGGGTSSGATSLFSSLDTSLGAGTPRNAGGPPLAGRNPLSGLPAVGSGGGPLWADGAPPSPHGAGGLAASDSPVYAQHLAGIRGGGHPSLSPFDHQPLTTSPAYSPHPGLVADDSPAVAGALFGGGLVETEPAGHGRWGMAGGWGSPPAAAGAGGGAAGFYGAGMQDAGGQSGRLVQERDLSDLMSGLLCR